MATPLDSIAQQMFKLAPIYDRSGELPQESLKLLEAAGVWRWVIPEAYGGAPLSPEDLVHSYATIAAGCLSTTLIVTQQHGACELIANGENEALKSQWLPLYACGQKHCTLGISQLTTSRRGGSRQVTAEPAGHGYRLEGLIPWSTAPAHCDHVVTGALVKDSQQQQLLICLPLDAPGVRVGPPMQLMALQQSQTTQIECDGVPIDPAWIVSGPGEKVLIRRSTVKPLTVSAVGIGFARRLLDHILERRESYDESFAVIFADIQRRYDSATNSLNHALKALNDPAEEVSAARVRAQVNVVITRLAEANLTLAKGSGFLLDQPAQRLLREAMFFLVWSVPPAVAEQTLGSLLELNGRR